MDILLLHPLQFVTVSTRRLKKMSIHNYLHDTLGFSNYEIAQIRYFVISILSELSKLLIIGLFFFFTHRLLQFLTAAFVLCLLRITTGGVHFKHYYSCLAMSFSIFFVGVCLLNPIYLLKVMQLPLLLCCIAINYACAPVVSCFRPIPDGIKVQRSKVRSFWLLTFFSILVFIFPQNQYINVGFWMIILQTLQLFAAKILKRRHENETSPNAVANS